MAEWRFLRRWDDGELDRALESAHGLPLNFDLHSEMSPRTGWNIVKSRALIACEEAGPPGRTFEQLWYALGRFHHSDPRIVLAHFREGVPLLDRYQLLELHSIGLRYLCPVMIGDTREEQFETATLRGFCLDTLDGHIERGREWFLLDKDHRTGEVRFRIEAIWRPGDFPNEWSRIGFGLVGRRYQRAWHRLCHLRLRRIAAGLHPDENVGPSGLVHEGPPMPSEPVQFYAQRGIGRLGVDVEQEREDMRKDRLWRAAGLGALSGVRSVGAPAVLTRTLEGRGKDVISGRKLPRLAPVLGVFGVIEALADKLPFIPPRTQIPSVIARAASGAFMGAAAARKREPKLAPALLGAVAATAGTYLAYYLRRFASQRSKALGYAAAVGEDALVLWSGSRLGGITAHATAR